MIRLSHIEKTYFGKGNETHALKNVNLKIQDNELCAIMGASGSGKSTLLHIIGAMDDVTGGSYLYNDIPVSKLSKKDLHGFRKKYVSFVFQNFALIERYSVYENLEVPLLARSVKKRKHIIEDAAERVGISGLLENIHQNSREVNNSVVRLQGLLLQIRNYCCVMNLQGLLTVKTALRLWMRLQKFTELVKQLL